MANLSKESKKTKAISNNALKTLLGRWMHWSVVNGHVYKDNGLTEETAAILFDKPLPKTVKFQKHLAAIEKLLHECAG